MATANIVCCRWRTASQSRKKPPAKKEQSLLTHELSRFYLAPRGCRKCLARKTQVDLHHPFQKGIAFFLPSSLPFRSSSTALLLDPRLLLSGGSSGAMAPRLRPRLAALPFLDSFQLPGNVGISDDMLSRREPASAPLLAFLAKSKAPGKEVKVPGNGAESSRSEPFGIDSALAAVPAFLDSGTGGASTRSVLFGLELVAVALPPAGMLKLPGNGGASTRSTLLGLEPVPAVLALLEAATEDARSSIIVLFGLDPILTALPLLDCGKAGASNRIVLPGLDPAPTAALGFLLPPPLPFAFGAGSSITVLGGLDPATLFGPTLRGIDLSLLAAAMLLGLLCFPQGFKSWSLKVPLYSASGFLSPRLLLLLFFLPRLSNADLMSGRSSMELPSLSGVSGGGGGVPLRAVSGGPLSSKPPTSKNDSLRGVSTDEGS